MEYLIIKMCVCAFDNKKSNERKKQLGDRLLYFVRKK